MGWWQRLKLWQKAGLIVGGIHLTLYTVILWLLGPISAYFLGYMEWPWLSLLTASGLIHGLALPEDLHFVILGIIGTFVYVLIGMVIGWLLSMIARKASIDRRP
jgi:hypothetical protein